MPDEQQSLDLASFLESLKGMTAPPVSLGAEDQAAEAEAKAQSKAAREYLSRDISKEASDGYQKALPKNKFLRALVGAGLGARQYYNPKEPTLQDQIFNRLEKEYDKHAPILQRDLANSDNITQRNAAKKAELTQKAEASNNQLKKAIIDAAVKGNISAEQLQAKAPLIQAQIEALKAKGNQVDAQTATIISERIFAETNGAKRGVAPKGVGLSPEAKAEMDAQTLKDWQAKLIFKDGAKASGNKSVSGIRQVRLADGTIIDKPYTINTTTGGGEAGATLQDRQRQLQGVFTPQGGPQGLGLPGPQGLPGAQPPGGQPPPGQPVAPGQPSPTLGQPAPGQAMRNLVQPRPAVTQAPLGPPAPPAINPAARPQATGPQDVSQIVDPQAVSKPDYGGLKPYGPAKPAINEAEAKADKHIGEVKSLRRLLTDTPLSKLGKFMGPNYLPWPLDYMNKSSPNAVKLRKTQGGKDYDTEAQITRLASSIAWDEALGRSGKAINETELSFSQNIVSKLGRKTKEGEQYGIESSPMETMQNIIAMNVLIAMREAGTKLDKAGRQDVTARLKAEYDPERYTAQLMAKYRKGEKITDDDFDPRKIVPGVLGSEKDRFVEGLKQAAGSKNAR